MRTKACYVIHVLCPWMPLATPECVYSSTTNVVSSQAVSFEFKDFIASLC